MNIFKWLFGKKGKTQNEDDFSPMGHPWQYLDTERDMIELYERVYKKAVGLFNWEYAGDTMALSDTKRQQIIDKHIEQMITLSTPKEIEL
jgi:hypothetical protein